MVKVNVRVRMDGKATVECASGHASRAAYNGSQRFAGKVRQEIRAAGRVNTGRMVNSVTATRDTRRDRLRPAYIVGPRVGYAKFQDRGTRAHGPKHKKFMRFKPKGKNYFVFAKWVRGVKAANFMAKAVSKLSARDFAR
nr:MAG TPA: type I neck protein [Caudoviricetes sp.]